MPLSASRWPLNTACRALGTRSALAFSKKLSTGLASSLKALVLRDTGTKEDNSNPHRGPELVGLDYGRDC